MNLKKKWMIWMENVLKTSCALPGQLEDLLFLWCFTTSWFPGAVFVARVDRVDRRRSPPAPGQSGRGRDEAREGWLDGRTETNQQYPTHGVVEDVVEDVILISPWVGTLGTNDFLGYNFMGIHTVYSKQVWIGGFLNRWDHDPKELSVQADRLGRFTSGRVYFRARLMSCSWRVWVDKPWLVSQGQPTKSD